ncbi:MAG: response regulator [Chloroflexota bacterium]|nr:response regulator [Chloroflexota bacterium]
MTRKILVVDDDPDIYEAVDMILTSRGYEVVSAHDGEEGLAALRAEKPDLMILDLLMPRKSGFAVLRELRESGSDEVRDMPVLILTSVREEASRRRYELETGEELDVDAYVEKPISPEILLERVENLIRKQQTV